MSVRPAARRSPIALSELEGLTPQRPPWPTKRRIGIAFLAGSLFVHSVAAGTLAWISPDRDRLWAPSLGGRSSAGSRSSMSASPEGTASGPTYFRVFLPPHQMALREKPPERRSSASEEPRAPTRETPAEKLPELAETVHDAVAEADLGVDERQTNAMPLLGQRVEDALAPGAEEYHLRPVAPKRAALAANAPPELSEVEAHAAPRPPRTDTGRSRVAELAYAPVLSDPLPGHLPSRGSGGEGAGSGNGPVYAPTPTYPPDAQSARQTGRVVLRLTIDPEGRVDDSQVLKSSGVASLDEAALTALRTWRFVARTRAWSHVVAIRFTLDD